YLTDEGIKTVSNAIGGDLEPRKIIDEALNRDLRDIGGGALATNREEASATLGGRIVLQVQKVRNIAAPKSNEESKAAPRLLQLELSDGQQTLQALELEPVPSLSLNVAPGTKIFFKAEKLQLMHGFLLLRQNEFQLLGGRVDALYEKWEFARTMLKYARSGRPLTGSTAPPPWVAFGKSINANDDRNFKSLVPAADKDKPSKEHDEFNATRNEAIAAASKVAVKKVFGGGGQNLVDYNIKKILDKGYSKDEAKLALQSTRNNLERALYNLKRRKDATAGNIEAPPMRGGRGERAGREGKRGASLKDEAEAAKPAANATLFDFLTTKLPPSKATELEVNADMSSKSSLATTADRPIIKHHDHHEIRTSTEHKFHGTSDRSRFENNVSSSFAANRGAPPGRLPRGGGRNRPTRGGGNFNSEPRSGGGGGGAVANGSSNNNNIRGRYENNSRTSEQIHGKSAGRNGHEMAVTSKAVVSEGKQEQDQQSTATKDQANNRRNTERQANRNGNYRVENTNLNNRRRQSGNGTNGGAPVTKATNAYGNNEDANTRLNKVVEDTANLKISSTKREREPRRGGKQSGGPSNRQQLETPANALPVEKKSTEKPMPPPQTQRQQPQPVKESPRQQLQSNASYSQLPNGYTYDPSKIMGFQSKETNEFAMSLLKSQGLTIAPQAAPPSNQPLPAQQSPPTMANNKPRNSFDALPAGPVNSIQLPPNPQPAVYQPPPEHFGEDAWMWKAGDLCMAKYWDDGRYYEAEITAVSENTCVVFFLGYGNHEEVLKSDMLPITDAQNRPLSNAPQPQHQNQHQKSRYRGERQSQQQQVYVPPHKREY
ncbi:hypothetical protein KR093_008841, partial [Drosophila rubida]